MSEAKEKDTKKKEEIEKGNRAFIRETIQEPRKKRNILKSILTASAVGIAFGVSASLSFALAGNWFPQVLDYTAESTRENIAIPRDQTPSSTALEETATTLSETPTETVAETLAESLEETSAVISTETETSAWDETDNLREEYLNDHIEAVLESMLENLDSEDFEVDNGVVTADTAECIDQVQHITKELKNSMVLVTTNSEEEDVFNHAYVRSQEAFGVVLAVTGQDVRILTESYLLEDADSVHIVLNNKKIYGAKLIGMDRTTGIACVSIPIETIEAEDMSCLKPVRLGNSYLLEPGDIVVALGNPMGYVPSVGWGIVSYIERNHQGTDLIFQLIQTDIAGDTAATGFLVNTQGEMVGWIKQDYSDESRKHLIAALSISDIKGHLESITNGGDLTSLGIQVLEINREMKQEQNLPGGLYISRCISDGPAFNAGIQNGDIIIRLGDTRLSTLTDLQTALAKCEPGETVDAVVLRGSRGGYAEQVFEVTLSAR